MLTTVPTLGGSTSLLALAATGLAKNIAEAVTNETGKPKTEKRRGMFSYPEQKDSESIAAVN